MFATRFSKYAWFVVLYTIGVIVWGAVVRATGSGAGCGNHWPICNGEILPSIAQLETAVEFIHRVTSALCGVFIIIMLVWAYRQPHTRFTRRMAILSFVFVLIEGAIGAALVRLELTANNVSTLRAVMIALHLINTLILLAFIALTAWGGAQKTQPRFVNRGLATPLMFIGIVGMSIMSAAGAVTALGDTLFLSGAIGQVTEDPYSHFLVQLRVIHPILAVVVSAYLFAVGGRFIQAAQKDSVRRLVYLMYGLIAFQMFIGVVNVAFLAPVAIQMLHLFLADVLWLTLVILSAEMLFETETTSVPAAQPVPVAA
jgi:heme a synthase